MAVDVARMEIDRLNNLIRNFDWLLTKQEILEEKIILTIEKLRPAFKITGSESVK